MARGFARRRRDGLCLVLLAALFLASVLLVDPRGDFPLNDDWSFVRSTRTLVADHDWRPLGWASMTQVTHAMLGYAVCAVSSCSFENLRAATLLAGLGLTLTSFVLVRWLGAGRRTATLTACAVVLNPVLTPLTFTFMTDVDFALLMVAAALACIALLRTARWRHVVLAAVLLLLATLSRQLAIAMAAALFPVYLLSARDRWGIRIVKSGLPLVTCLVGLLCYEHWMRQTGRLSLLYDSKYQDLLAASAAPGHLLVHAAFNLILSGLYLGLVCLPLLLLKPIGGPAPGIGSVTAGLPGRWASLVSTAALLSMVRNGTLMPLLGNVLGKGGIGPFTLRDTYVLGLHDVPDLPVSFWIAVTGFGLLGLWLLVFHALSLMVEAWPRVVAGRLTPPLAIRLFGILTVALYLLPLLPGEVYDRYLVVMAPILCIGLLSPEPRPVRGGGAMATVLACGYAAGLAAVAVLGTHDYLAWNRARWSAIADVEAAHEADAATMDGGFEYDGYRRYDERYGPEPSKSWWWVADDAFQIGFGPMPGTHVLRRYAYRTWLPPDTRSILVLRRDVPLPAR